MQKAQQRLLISCLAITFLFAVYTTIPSYREPPATSPLELFITENDQTEEMYDFPNSFITSTHESISLNMKSEQSKARILANQPNLIVNNEQVSNPSATTVVNETTYVSIESFLNLLDPDADISNQKGKLLASGKGFRLKAYVGQPYMTLNDRYLYIPDGVIAENGYVMVPIRTLSHSLGATTNWEPLTETINVKSDGKPLRSGSSFYNQDELYWLSRIINAESRNQPLVGKIAVGTVILNRVESHQFPNSVHDVIFSGIQFSPVDNGSIYLEPSRDSVIAAKLALDGAREAGDSLFFHRKNLNAWAARNKTYVTTIADHSFYQ